MIAALWWLAFAIAGLIVSANTRVTVPVLGSVSVLGLIAMIVLTLAIGGVLLLLRNMACNGWPGWRPRTVTW